MCTIRQRCLYRFLCSPLHAELMSPLGCTTVSSIRLHPDASGWTLRLTKAKQRLCKMLNPSEEPLICECNASPGLSSSSVALVEGSPWYICWPSKDPASHNAIIPLRTHDTLWKLWSVIKNITLPKFRCPPIRREVALWRRMKHNETSQKLPFSTRESDAIPYEMSSTQEHFAHFALTAFSFLPVVFHRWRLFPFVWLLLVCCFSWTTRTKATSPSSSCFFFLVTWVEQLSGPLSWTSALLDLLEVESYRTHLASSL